MRKAAILMLAAVAMLVAGCSSPRLANGKYESRIPGQDDYIIVYDDLVFLHIKTPDNLPERQTYWTWAGKYSISDSGELDFDMNDELKKKWRFSYTFVNQQGGVVLNDWGTRTGRMLYYERPTYRELQVAPAAMPNTSMQ